MKVNKAVAILTLCSLFFCACSQNTLDTNANGENTESIQEPKVTTENINNSETVNQFANQTGETFQQASKNLNETWKKQDKKTQTNLIMLAVASIPAILWALGMILLGIASDDLSAGLITALLSVIINFPLVVLLILPALLNKTDKKWPIFILSFLLGWTFIGWIILLAVSINTNKEAERIRQQQMMMQMAGQQGSSDTFNPFQ